MFAWHTIRTFCVVMLCLPLLHLGIVVSRDVAAKLDSSPDAWLHEVEAYARLDQSMTMPENPVVVVGGRRVKQWEGLRNILASEAVLMRGMGDATIEDISHHYKRLVAYHRPSTVVFLPSDSEFHIRDSKNEQEYMHAIRKMAATDARHGGDWSLILFAPIKSPLRPSDHDKIDIIARELQAFSAENDRIEAIDANPLLALADGAPNPAYFRPNGSSLNEAGYVRLGLLLDDALAEGYADVTVRNR